MKKRSIAVAFCVMVCAFPLISQADDASEEMGAKTLTYWSMWSEDDPQAAAIEELLEGYSEDTGITVEVAWKGREISNLLPEALESGEKIDLYDDDFRRVVQKYSRYNEDLEEMAEAAEYGSHGVPFLVEEARSQAGSLRAIPYQIYFSVETYAKESFQEQNLTEPVAWENFLELCTQLQERDSGEASMTVTVEASGLAVPAYSDNAQEAFGLIMKMVSGEGDVHLSKQTNRIPADMYNEDWPELLAICRNRWQEFTGMDSQSLYLSVGKTAEDAKRSIESQEFLQHILEKTQGKEERDEETSISSNGSRNGEPLWRLKAD